MKYFRHKFDAFFVLFAHLSGEMSEECFGVVTKINGQSEVEALTASSFTKQQNIVPKSVRFFLCLGQLEASVVQKRNDFDYKMGISLS